jgi:hypothetical protein
LHDAANFANFAAARLAAVLNSPLLTCISFFPSTGAPTTVWRGPKWIKLVGRKGCTDSSGKMSLEDALIALALQRSSPAQAIPAQLSCSSVHHLLALQ